MVSEAYWGLDLRVELDLQACMLAMPPSSANAILALGGLIGSSSYWYVPGQKLSIPLAYGFTVIRNVLIRCSTQADLDFLISAILCFFVRLSLALVSLQFTFGFQRMHCL
jgi:hypothetical protein